MGVAAASARFFAAESTSQVISAAAGIRSDGSWVRSDLLALRSERVAFDRLRADDGHGYRAGVQAYHDPPGTDAPITQAEVLAYRRWRSEFQKEEAELADEALRVAEAADTEENEEA